MNLILGISINALIIGYLLKKHWRNFVDTFKVLILSEKFLEGIKEYKVDLGGIKKVRKSYRLAAKSVFIVAFLSSINGFIWSPFDIPKHIFNFMQVVLPAFFILWAITGKVAQGIQSWDEETPPENVDQFAYLLLSAIGTAFLFFTFSHTFFRSVNFVEFIFNIILKIIEVGTEIINLLPKV